MPISRKFLDWSQPALPAAADYLLQRYRSGSQLNLDSVLVVVPGSRAGRRLLEILVERAEQGGLVLAPPCIETAGTLPERLYEPKQPFASELVQQLAWIHALRTAGRSRIVRVVPQLPDDGDVVRWMSLGRLLWRAHRELAAEGLDFNDVVGSEWRSGELEEKARWRVLRRVQELYLRVLDHFQLWDLQTARLFAIQHRECQSDKDIILLGTADLNIAVRQMLDQVADRVTALVHAPQELAGHFDTYGCIRVEPWIERPIPITAEQVQVVEGPEHQAAAAARSLASWDGWRRADEITIGVPDDTLLPQLRRQLQQCGVATRWAVGMRMPDTSPYRLLRALADYLERGRYVDFAALVRHPVMFDYLEQQGAPDGWLNEMDCYYKEHLQPRLGQWLGPPEHCEASRQAWELVERLLKPLRIKARKLGLWAQRIIDVVVQVHDHVELDRDDPAQHYTVAACRQIQNALLQHQLSPAKLTPVTECWQALRLCLDQLHNAEIAPLPDPEAVELLGWLELPLDTAPVLVVTGFNEGHVPTSVNSDLFLPNGLRRRLGLLDNDRRLARDAYALSVLAASRESLTLIAGRFDGEGNPLTPSRLLFAAEDDEEVARRAVRFFDRQAEAGLPLPGALAAAASGRLHSQFAIPRPPDPPPPIDALGVTSFRTYLACPYRFYLRHVLKLRALDDRAEELDAPSFGSLLHEVLSRFGRSACRESADAEEVRQQLRSDLDECIAERFGDERLAPVNVQLYQLRSRLDAFADWQAGWVEQGWRIAHTEVPQEGAPARLPVGDRQVLLFGRIDRIDRHEQTGEWIVFDYKTSDTERSPDEAHRRAGQWVDLQLPLYRHLARQLGVVEPLRLGYILLPKDVSRVGSFLADWSEADLASADRAAAEVARQVLEGKFWPPAERPPLYDEFATVCMQGVFDRPFVTPGDKTQQQPSSPA